jgi:ABC-type multidrug transport system permease subunit
MSYSPLVQMSLTKVRGILREPEAIFWVVVFPVLLSIALGIAFRASGPAVMPVAVQEGAGAAELFATLDDDDALSVELLDAARAREALRTGKVAVVIVPGDHWTFWFDPTRPESREARLVADAVLQRAAGREDAHPTAVREMTEKGSRYIDFLIPGLLGMNLMGTGMWSIGFSIVNSRQRRILKRFVATPMRRWQYLLAQFIGRLVFLVIEVSVLIGCATLLFGVPVRGAWALLGAVCGIGAFTFAAAGLLVASRPRTVEGVSGLMNLVMMPMWILSGTFFSTERFPEVMQPIVQALPLTALNDALRQVMIEGAGLSEIAGEIAIFGGWGILAFFQRSTSATVRPLRWAYDATWSRPIFPTAKYFDSGCEKYRPLTEAAGHMA